MPIREYHRDILRQKKRRRSFSFFKFFALFFASFLVLSVLGGLLLFIYYARDLPRPEKFLEKEFVQSTKIYDRTGEVLLYEIYGEEKREVVSLEQIPLSLRNAVIAAEDANFYHHFGIDLKAIGRAVLADLKLREPVQGASTIPQQLIRSSFLTREKTLGRKIKEVILTLELDRRYPKDQILEWYLNQVSFGPNIYGVETASKSYFGKSVSEITLAQSALLAATIKAPSYLYPYGEHLEELLGRKDYVLNRMADLGYISQEEKVKSQKEEIKFVEASPNILAPHFVMYVKDLLEQKYGTDFLKEEGLKVYTTLDFELQKSAEEIVKNQSKINEKYRAFNASLVALSPKTGEILAMVGSKNWFSSPYPEGCLPGKNCLFEPYPNVALRGRQPGSAFKPFVYATVFKRGYDDKIQVLDESTNFGIWGGKEYIPQNYDGKFRGIVTLREGLAQSLNIPSVKVLYLIGSDEKIEKLEINNFLGKEGVFSKGLKESIGTAKEMGITTLTQPISFYGPSIVLGGGEVKLLEMVSAYGVFASEGLKVEPTAILKIEDSKGNILEENNKIPRRVLEPGVAQLINDILADNEARTPIFGPRSPLYFEGFKVSVKTGTTDNFRDGWAIGYTPNVVVGVWVGNNDQSPMQKEPGIVVAGPIFHQLMEKALIKL
jgi:membrane peptidoglycan carboxypeptidase